MPSNRFPLQYILSASGPAARPTLWLDWVFIAISVGVCLVIAGLLAGGLVRRRTTTGVMRRDVTREGRGLYWMLFGTGASVVVLTGMAVYALVALNNVAAPPKPPALQVAITGYDWWWRADYGDFATANEIHIPTGVPVLMILNSADVIHAFWVPQLAGKTQTIPGQTNRQWLQADTPGIYRGQCTQFCGLQHAHMAFEVVAQTPADYARWRAAQARSALATGLPGEAMFVDRCGGCHTVRGSQATGMHGPDLTHLMSRRTIAAGLMPLTPANLMNWIEHPQALKPGAQMPDTVLTPGESADLSAYLQTLR
jgi:cytochrome c oxidase subunit 2